MNTSDLKKAQLLKLFKVNKCVTLETICNYLNNSGRSTQRLLKSIGYYSSFTHNGKWYTLHDVPKFDIDGLWFYNGIGFSQLKDINSTIFHLIDKSEKGLTANDLSKLLSTSCPPILNRLYKKNKIDRVKAHGGFVYLSVKKAIRGQQVANIEKTECLKLPSKTDTISILVEFIRNPNCTLEELSSNLNQKGIFCDSATIKNLFVHLSLEKKIPTI